MSTHHFKHCTPQECLYIVPFPSHLALVLPSARCTPMVSSLLGEKDVVLNINHSF